MPKKERRSMEEDSQNNEDNSNNNIDNSILDQARRLPHMTVHLPKSDVTKEAYKSSNPV
jgi:hypothetical protein